MATIELLTVKEWIGKNPYKMACLPVYTSSEKAKQNDESIESNAWTKKMVSPSTPLSAIMVIQDDIYSVSPVTARHSQLRDETTSLQEKAALQLKGRAWPVRRTAEGIAGIGLEEERHSMWTPLGFRALCALRECQLIVINETLKSVAFYPEDVRLWSKDIPVYVLDSSSHIVLIPSGDYTIFQWIQKQESLGFSIEWPEMEGTLDELKVAATKVGEPTTKVVKATLQRKVGKAQSIQILKEW